jgi:mannose-1-phosphate guanylyltransferase
MGGKKSSTGHESWWAAVLAGGAGTRFWPASREKRPKPFLDIFGKGTLISHTVERIRPLIADDHLYFVVGEALVDVTTRSVAESVSKNLIVEPVARNTLGAVLLAMGRVMALDPNGKVAILPADHMIRGEESFRKTLWAAFQLCDEHVVTLGVVPSYPETGYGYIRKGKPFPGRLPTGASGVTYAERFVEKPNREIAVRFLADGQYLWNSGMFVFSCPMFLKVVSEVDPYFGLVATETAEMFRKGKAYPERIRALLEPLPNRNIDKAVMEYCSKMLVIPAAFPWSDVGSWDSAFDQRPEGSVNCLVGDVMIMGGQGNLVVSGRKGQLVTLCGVSDLVVVAMDDAILVTRRGFGQDVGKIVEELKRRGRTELL